MPEDPNMTEVGFVNAGYAGVQSEKSSEAKPDVSGVGPIEYKGVPASADAQTVKKISKRHHQGELNVTV